MDHEGCVRGSCAFNETVLVQSKCSGFCAPESEGGVFWSDPDLDIAWPVKTPMISNKDSGSRCLRDLPVG